MLFCAVILVNNSVSQSEYQRTDVELLPVYFMDSCVGASSMYAQVEVGWHARLHVLSVQRTTTTVQDGVQVIPHPHTSYLSHALRKTRGEPFVQ